MTIGQMCDARFEKIRMNALEKIESRDQLSQLPWARARA
jgi:hypothetical protein